MLSPNRLIRLSGCHTHRIQQRLLIIHIISIAKKLVYDQTGLDKAVFSEVACARRTNGSAKFAITHHADKQKLHT